MANAERILCITIVDCIKISPVLLPISSGELLKEGGHFYARYSTVAMSTSMTENIEL